MKPEKISSVKTNLLRKREMRVAKSKYFDFNRLILEIRSCKRLENGIFRAISNPYLVTIVNDYQK